ncbi:MAG: DUF1109 domain-containing protein [Rhizobiales bacterium]|nr:DUF1109 domain-containing protein [Hyphomicrobiales bacterium]
MTTTYELIATLSANARPVRRLRPPLFRAACWLLLAAVVLVLIGIGQGIRPNFAQRLGDWTFVVQLLGSLLTGIAAAVAAFMLSLPDRSRWWRALPLPPLVAWLATIGRQCLTNWVAMGPEGMGLGETARCLATLGLTSLPLSLAMLAMLRYCAPLRPTNVVLMGSLAVAGITATALMVFHPLDATVMILVFNLGTALVIVGIGCLVNLLAWR